MEKKLEIIDESGQVTVFGKEEKVREPFYHLITETPEGQRIAFGVDQGNK